MDFEKIEQTGLRPKQRIPNSKKIGKGKEAEKWRIANVKYFSETSGNNALYRLYMKDLFKVASGYLDKDSYKFITNPSDTAKRKSTKQYNQEINNYDIITPILMTFMGDKIDRMLKPTVSAINSDIENIKLEEEKRLVNEQLDKIVLNSLKELSQTNIPEQSVKSQKEIKEIIDNIKDQKSIDGAKALEYIMINNEILRKFRKNFYNWLVTYCCFSVRNVLNKDIEYDVISPIDVNYNISEGLDFIEDGEFASVIYNMSNSEILDRFHDQLSEEDRKRLDVDDTVSSQNKELYYTDTDIFYESMVNSGKIDGKATLHSEGLSTNKVYYVNWKSQIKIGRLEIVNILGETEYIEVDEDFKPRKDEEVEWFWVNQVWEGWKINENIFFGIRPIPFQRGKLDNPSSCKLLINGRVFMNSLYRNKSIVERLLPYQKKYNVISYHLEKLINKNKDKIVKFPYSAIPDNENLNMFDMMYFADKDSFMFYDDSDDKKAAMAAQGIGVLDMSLSDNMRFLSDMLKIIKAEAEEAVGINRQRLGKTNSSDGKGANEDAIQRSTIITSEIFEQYEEYEEREWQCLLDLSKFAWIGGKKAAYVNSSGRRVMLELDEGYRELEHGVRATRSSKEIRKLEKYRSDTIQQAFIQNGVAISTLIKMDNVDSLSEMEDIIQESENQLIERSKAASEAEQQSEQQKIQLEVEQKEKDREVTVYKTDADNLSREKVALINNETSIITAGMSSDNPDQTSSSLLEEDDSTEILRKNNLERRKLDQNDKKLQIEREKIKASLENPVVGEKK